MSLKTEQLVNVFSETLKKTAKGTKPYDTVAEVTRVEDDTVWVHIPSGVYETPIRKTIACAKGDMVQVRVAGGNAWITGNATAPPTDDKLAKVVQGVAESANASAINAKETADEAQITADTAQETADTVNNAVNGEGGINDTLNRLTGAVDVVSGSNPYVMVHTNKPSGEMNAGIKITDTRFSMMGNAEEEVAYIDSTEERGTLNIVTARVQRLIFGELEQTELNGGWALRRI